MLIKSDIKTGPLFSEQKVITTLPDNPQVFLETVQEKANRTAEFAFYFDAILEKNIKRLDTEHGNKGTIQKDEVSFAAVDSFRKIVAADKGVSLPLYGVDQTEANLFSIQLFGEIFNQLNPTLEAETRQILTKRIRLSYSAILAYLIVEPKGAEISFKDIPDEYLDGVAIERIVHKNHLKKPQPEDIEAARNKYLDEKISP